MTDDRASVEERRTDRRPVKDGSTRPRRFPPRTLSRILPWVLAAAFLAAAVTFAFLWLGARGSEERQAEAVETTRRFLATLTNFNGRNIEKDVEEIRDFAVGQFASEVDETFSGERIAAIEENNAVSTGRVESVLLQTLEGSSATAFGVVRETIVNDDLPAPRIDVLRVEVGLIETPDGWKVNSVQILQSPGAGPFG